MPIENGQKEMDGDGRLNSVEPAYRSRDLCDGIIDLRQEQQEKQRQCFFHTKKALSSESIKAIQHGQHE